MEIIKNLDVQRISVRNFAGGDCSFKMLNLLFILLL